MSEDVLRREYYGIPGWTWLLVGLGGVFGTVYLLYKYFVEPGEVIIEEYKTILQDIYKETKSFLEENAELDPPIYGLTEPQKQIIAAKEEAAERLRPIVEEVVTQRGQDIMDVALTIGIAIVVALAAPAVITSLTNLLKEWRKKPESSNIQSSYGHVYVIHELVANEMALTGQLNIASGFMSTIQSLYADYTEPGLNTAISYYNSILPGLTPGTLQWLVVTQLLNYMMFEVSATGIMGALWTFWYPPLI